jgi:hypothetical protein
MISRWPLKIAIMNRTIDMGLFRELADPRVALTAVACASEARPGGSRFNVTAERPPDAGLRPRERAGLTWAVTRSGSQLAEAEVHAVIDAAPAA